MRNRHTLGWSARLIFACAAAGLVTSSLLGQLPDENAKPANGTNTPPATAVSNAPAPIRRSNGMSQRAIDHYQLIYGIDNLDVKAVESGQMIRFSYQVLDPVKAAILNDKKINPSLVDPQAGVRLDVPTMEKVGQLRQSSTPETGKVYWMLFSNKGGIVKPGDRVAVIIGRFRADGLYVR